MTFFESIQTCLRKYATFDGVARRSEYWWFYLFQLIVSAIAQEISPTLGGVVALALLLPSLAAGTRRLHDTDRSGWWQLLVFVPVIGWIVLIVWLAQDSRQSRYGLAPAYAG